MIPGFENMVQDMFHTIAHDSIKMITEFVIPKLIEIFTPYIPLILVICGISIIGKKLSNNRKS